MKATYQGTCRFLRNGKTEVHVKFFSGRGQTESPKAMKEMDEWCSEMLQKHGAYDCDVTTAKVLFHIKG